MKKMLVIFLILFTKVLADSDEDNYVDLLPEEEKEQFLENVARRILKEVKSKENVTGAQSGEVSDHQLQQHTEYVKSIIKEEQRSVKNKGDVNDEKSKSASEEKDVLGVEPLVIEKTSDERTSNNIAAEDVTDNAPIIKRSVEDDKASNVVQSDETSEKLQKVSQNKIISENTNEIETQNEKNINENNTSDVKVSFEKDMKVIKSTTAGDKVDKVVSVRSNQTDDALNVSVRALHEFRRTNKEYGKLAENTTDIDTTTSTVEVVKSTENKPDEYNNVSSTENEFTTLTYPFESSSLKGNTTESTTLDGILFASTTELSTKKKSDSESLLKSKNTSKDSENEFEIKTTISTRNTINEETTDSVTATTGSVIETTKPVTETTDSVTETTEPVTETTDSVTETTDSATEATESVTETIKPVTETKDSVTETTEPVTETTDSVTETTDSVTEATDSVTETTESVTEATESVTETTKPVTETTKSVIETIEFVPETTIESEIVTIKAPTESTNVLYTTQSVPVASTEKFNIIVEDFTSAPTPATTIKYTILDPKTTTEKKKMDINKRIDLLDEVTPAATKSIEAAKKKSIKHKVIVHKPVKVIIGPKAKKMAEEKEAAAQNNNFIELEKVYFDNNYKVNVGKEYHVYEIAAGQSPFTKEMKEPPVADQPYYVPVYNYAPNKAYFNPQNRLGPNAEDSSAEINAFFKDDDYNNLDKTETLNVKMEYDRMYDSKRKKFGSKYKTHGLHKQPQQPTKIKRWNFKLNLADYLDSDYYFGRVGKPIARKSNLGTFPNSDEADHPANSIREGSLKDHVRAVRNILFKQKSFGLLEKDKYGTSVEQAPRKGRPRNVEKKSLRTDEDEDFKHSNNIQKKNNDKNKEDRDDIGNGHYLGRNRLLNKHIQKVGYFKKQNQTKELYVMDDFFKANVEKYIEEQSISQATPHPYIENKRDEPITFFKKDGRWHRANMVKPDQDDIPVNVNSDNVTENLKLSLTKNEVIKVSVYLQVLKDMVALDNKALVQFDWLGTTVDIQAALQKLFELTALIANEEDVHPSDMEMLKYVLFIHKLASEIIKANEFGAHLRKKLALPRSKNKKLIPKTLTEEGLINKVWLRLRKAVPEVNEHGALKELNSFFIGVEDGLYDLHDAIKNIAKITKYKNQHWYQNLKDLYIDTDEKHLLELLLHLTALRLFTLIEESAKNGLEDDYINYMKQNRQHSKRTLEEMIFILDILEEYNKYVE